MIILLAKHLSANGCKSAYPDEESAKRALKDGEQHKGSSTLPGRLQADSNEDDTESELMSLDPNKAINPTHNKASRTSGTNKIIRARRKSNESCKKELAQKVLSSEKQETGIASCTIPNPQQNIEKRTKGSSNEDEKMDIDQNKSWK